MVFNNRRIILLLMLFCINSLSAQELGNPISYLNPNEFSVSLYGEQVWRDFDGASYNSLRAMTKTELGLSKHIKVFGLLGVDKLFINNSNSSRLTDYKGRFEFAYGGGAQLNLFSIYQTSLFTAGGLLRTSSRNSIISSVTDEEVTINLDFDWREYWFAFGVSREIKNYIFYGGLEERSMDRREKVSNTEYISGLKHNIFVGIDVRMPKNFVISFKFKTLDQNILSFGISQRSIGKIK